MRRECILALVAALASRANAVNFPYEKIQLTDDDTDSFSALKFAEGLVVTPRATDPRCKAFPGSDDWPSGIEWSRLDTSMNGRLLRPIPPAAACYSGPSRDQELCSFLLLNSTTTRFWADDPLTAQAQWAQGTTCPLLANPQGECTQGGYPVYVANVTTARDVQLAVNFARNRNIRLIIK
jgi:hypothetical protein